MPVGILKMMYPGKYKEHIKPMPNVKLTAYNGIEIPCHGITDMPSKFKDSEWMNTEFFIVDVTGLAVVGISSCEKLKLVTLHCAVNQSPVNKPTIINSVNDLKEHYPNQFDRIGKFRGNTK